MSGFLKVFCAVWALLLTTSPSAARSPMPRRCDKKIETTLITKAKKIFPGINLKPMGCRYFGNAQQVYFRSFDIQISKNFSFHVSSPMFLRAEKQVDDLFDRNFKNKKPEYVFMMVPFSNLKMAKEAAAKITQTDLFRHTFGKSNVICNASTDAPGSTAYYKCYEKPATGTKRPQTWIHFQQTLGHPSYSQVTGIPKVYEYDLPLSIISKTSQGILLKKQKEVSDFISKHKNIRVSALNWHSYYLTFSSPDTKDNLVLVYLQHAIYFCKNKEGSLCVMEARKNN